MRLLQLHPAGGFSLTNDLIKDIPSYAILSHTWGEDVTEVTFQDLERGTGHGKAGYAKLQFCAKQAHKDKIEYFWVDTCCIDKANHAELSEAIISMFRWYQQAVRCYVYLSDVSYNPCENIDTSVPAWAASFRSSRWFTRGWTLQELLAPANVLFFSKEGHLLGTKSDLLVEVHQITGIPINALRGAPLSDFPVSERRLWAENRDTTREEDQVYCLLGICGVIMLPMYGETKDNAEFRLDNAIQERYGLLHHNSSTYTSTGGDVPEGTWAILRRVTNNQAIDEIWRSNCAQKFHKYDYHAALQALAAERCPSTGNWLLTNETYQSWNTSRMNSILWVVGGAGSGKSILSTVVLQPALTTNPSNQVSQELILYSHFKSEFNTTSNTLLCTLIHQVLQGQPDLTSRADAFGPSASSTPQLLALFRDLVRTIRKSIKIVLDGLDFTELPGRVSLVGDLLLCRPGVKVIITTRDHQSMRAGQGLPHISQQMREYVLNLDTHCGQSLLRDRAVIVDKELETGSLWQSVAEEEKNRIRARISMTENILVCKIMLLRMRLGQRDAKFAVSVETLPLTLTGLYSFLVGELRARCTQQCVQLFRYLLYARSTLPVAELAHGLFRDPDINSVEIIQKSTDLIEQCYPLIQLQASTTKVELVHRSAQEFLRTHLSGLRSTHTFHLGVSEAEQEMATDCLLKITTTPVNVFPPVGTDSFRRYIDRVRPVLKDQPLLRYALRNWYWHLQQATATAQSKDELATPLLRAISYLSKTWQHAAAQQIRYLAVKMAGIDHMDPAQELRQFPFFCALGLTPLVDAQTRKYVHERNYAKRIETALRLAIAGGHSVLARKLIAEGAITTLDSPAYKDLLVKLVQKQQYEMMEVMLQMRHVSLEEISVANAFTFKVGDEKAFNILRDSRAFHQKSGTGATVLHNEAASENAKGSRNPETLRSIVARIKILVEQQNIDVNARESTTGNRICAVWDKRKTLPSMGNTALHAACLNSAHPDVIRALIEVGADVKIKNHFGWTALHIAGLYSRNSGVIDLLLAAGGDHSVAALTEGGNSPLHWAAAVHSVQWGHTSREIRASMIKTLLRAGADPLLSNHAGETPMELAASSSSGQGIWQVACTAFDGLGHRRNVTLPALPYPNDVDGTGEPGSEPANNNGTRNFYADSDNGYGDWTPDDDPPIPSFASDTEMTISDAL